MPIRIIGWGEAPPDPNCWVSNEEVLARIVFNLRDEDEARARIDRLTGDDVENKIGVVDRQYRPDRSATDLAKLAARCALERAATTLGYQNSDRLRKQIGIIISGGSTPEDLYPCCAAKLQVLLDLPRCAGFDVSLACCSGTEAISTAGAMMNERKIDYGLVAIGEVVGSQANALRNENATLWGDGGGAVVLMRDTTDEYSNYGIVASKTILDGSKADTTKSRGLGVAPVHRNCQVDASMEGCGREIYRWILTTVPRELKAFLQQCSVTITDRTFLLPHNGNLKMVHALGSSVGIPNDRVLNLIQKRDNQSSASILSTFAHYADSGTFRTGDVLVMASFGGGLAMSFVIYRYY